MPLDMSVLCGALSNRVLIDSSGAIVAGSGNDGVTRPNAGSKSIASNTAVQTRWRTLLSRIRRPARQMPANSARRLALRETTSKADKLISISADVSVLLSTLTRFGFWLG